MYTTLRSPAVERHHLQGGLVEGALRGVGGEEDVLAVGQRLRPAVRRLSSLGVERR